MDSYFNAYIAGFFDGEGSALIITDRRQMDCGIIYRIRPHISVSQKNREILDKIREYFGFGNIQLSTYGIPNRAGYKYICNGHKNITKFIEEVHPYVIIKKRQLDLIKELIDFKDKIQSNKPYTKENTLFMLDIRDELHELNSRGKDLRYSREKILSETNFIDVDEWHKKRAKKGCKAMVAYQKARKIPRKAEIIECVCGCGGTLNKYDGRNRIRTHIRGHNPRGKTWRWKKLEGGDRLD